MRGFLKAAALLSPLSASASIVPRSLPTKYDETLDSVLKYSKYHDNLFRRTKDWKLTSASR